MKIKMKKKQNKAKQNKAKKKTHINKTNRPKRRHKHKCCMQNITCRGQIKSICNKQHLSNI